MTTVTRGRIVIPTTVYIKPESTGFNIYISTTINELIVKDLQLNKIYLVFGSVDLYIYIFVFWYNELWFIRCSGRHRRPQFNCSQVKKIETEKSVAVVAV